MALHQYTLFDGAMVPGGIELDARWMATLLPTDELHARVPVLVGRGPAGSTSAPNEAELKRRVGEIANGYPNRLHAAAIASPLPFDALVQHLRKFACCTESTGQTYALRIADCRVMAYLPKVLTPAQWNAMTAPIHAWNIHDRRGDVRALALDESRQREVADAPAFLHLDDDQIARLMDEGEADALLAHLDLDPTKIAPRHLQTYFDVARRCIEAWQRHDPRADRRVLCNFAIRVFDDRAAWLGNEARVKRELDALAIAQSTERNDESPGRSQP